MLYAIANILRGHLDDCGLFVVSLSKIIYCVIVMLANIVLWVITVRLSTLGLEGKLVAAQLMVQSYLRVCKISL